MDLDRTVTRDLALLLVDPRTGRRLQGASYWKTGLAGAAMSDLLLGERLRLTGPGEPGVKAGRLAPVIGGTALSPAWQRVADQSDGRRPKDAISRIAGGRRPSGEALWDEILDRLQRQEVLAREEERILGLIRRERIRIIEPEVREEVVHRLDATLEGSLPISDRTATVVGILAALGLLPRVLPARDKRWLKRQAKVVADGNPGAEAVRKAIAEIQAALAASAAVASVAATGATSG